MGHSAEFLARIMAVVSSLEKKSKEVLQETVGLSELHVEKDLGKLYRTLSLSTNYEGGVTREECSFQLDRTLLKEDQGTAELFVGPIVDDTADLACLSSTSQYAVKELKGLQHPDDEGFSCSRQLVSERSSPNGADCEELVTRKGHSWHWMLRQRLSEPQALKIHRGPVNALLLSDDNASESLTLYSVGKDGFIKVCLF